MHSELQGGDSRFETHNEMARVVVMVRLLIYVMAAVKYIKERVPVP